MADAASSTAPARARRAGPKRRGGAAGSRRFGGAARARFPLAFRWARVLLLVLAVVVGLPLAHAMLGEVAALLGAAALLGFLLGRWTAPA